MNKIGKEYLDDLTGVYNRRYLKKKQKEIENLQKNNIPFSIAMVDVDYFKRLPQVEVKMFFLKNSSYAMNLILHRRFRHRLIF